MWIGNLWKIGKGLWNSGFGRRARTWLGGFGWGWSANNHYNKRK
ncbi:hypothetical protein [Thermoflavimicrobium daqui]|nr:hypothetical protein [Thermoflavimicrobium daqui]